MNHAQQNGDTVATRLTAAGVDLAYAEGRDNGSYIGLQHAKFMRIDGRTIAMGSNNYSSTSLSLNNENTMILTSDPEDPLLMGFGCYFEEMFGSGFEEAASRPKRSPSHPAPRRPTCCGMTSVPRVPASTC